MDTKPREIRIAGGGIAGLSSAILLARAGHPVHVFEKRSEIGSRFKGDLQGLENWSKSGDVLEEIKSMGLEIPLINHPLPPLKIIDGHRLDLDFTFQRPLCYLVKRGTDDDSLDQTLKRAALAEGVQIHLKQRLSEEAADIVATGPRSKQIFAVDLGIKFKTSHPDTAIALVNDDAAYKGYAYLLVVDGYGCLCTVLFDRFNTLQKSFEKAKEILLKKVKLDILNPQQVGGVGGFDHGLKFATGNQLFIGEAAGIQDFLFGFGIRSAIRSGYLAAKSILQNVEYEASAYQEFYFARKAGIVCRYLYEKASHFKRGYPMLSKLVWDRSDPHWFLSRAYRFTPIHQALFPLARYAMSKRYPNIMNSSLK